MARRILKLRFDRVDVVDRGANQGSHILLMKRDDGGEVTIDTPEDRMSDAAVFVADLVKLADPQMPYADAVNKAASWLPELFEAHRAVITKGAPSGVSDARRRQNIERRVQQVSHVIDNGRGVNTAQRLAWLRDHLPELMREYFAASSEPEPEAVADAPVNKRLEARASVYDAVRSGAQRLVDAGVVRTPEEGVLHLMKADPSLHRLYREAGR